MRIQEETHRRWTAVLALLAVALVPACKSLGPDKVPPDQFDYNQAIGQASNEQMMLNLIRLRYRDVPVFLAVNSVLTQYIYTGNVNAAGTVGTLQAEPANSATVGAGFRYIERPTITYSPLAGEDFAEQMMTPIPVDLMFSLIQSGWPAVELMMMGVERLGAARNVLFPALFTAEGQQQREQFREVVELVLLAAQRDAIETVQTPGGDRHLLFAQSADPETAALVDELKERLGLSADQSRFRVTSNLIALEQGDVTIRVRSLLDLMGYLSGGVHIRRITSTGTSGDRPRA